MKRLVLFALLLAAAVAIGVAPAAATTPCRDRIYNDWYRDGKIASTYPTACYRDAIKHVPTDARVYSSLVADIRAAMRGALARAHGQKNVPAQIGKGGHGSVSSTSQRLSTTTSAPHDPVRPADSPQSTTVAAAPTTDDGGIPLPLLVLGGIAALLVAAGAVGAGLRFFRGRAG